MFCNIGWAVFILVNLSPNQIFESSSFLDFSFEVVQSKIQLDADYFIICQCKQEEGETNPLKLSVLAANETLVRWNEKKLFFSREGFI
jgi:hypothetical protein